MSAQKVTEKIIGDAEKEARDIIKKYEDEAAQIRDNYERRIAEKKGQIEQEIEERKRTELLRALSQKRLELNKQLTVHKQKLISELIAQTTAGLAEHKDYLHFLKSLIKSSGENAGELFVSDTDFKHFGSDLEKFLSKEKSSLNLAVNNEIKSGIIIKRGKTDYIGSLDVILELLSDELAIAIAKIVY